MTPASVRRFDSQAPGNLKWLIERPLLHFISLLRNFTAQKFFEEPLLMGWLRWQPAPKPNSAKTGLRALRPELLEPRLALNHAPLADDSHAVVLAVASHSAPVIDASRSSADSHGAGQNAPLVDPGGYNAPVGQIPASGSQPLPRVDVGVTNAVSSAIVGPDDETLELIAIVRSAFDSGSEFILIERVGDQSAVIPGGPMRSSAESNLLNSNAILTFGVSSTDPATTAPMNPTVVSSYGNPFQNPTATVPVHNVPLALPADVVRRVAGAEPANTASLSPLFEHPQFNREHPAAPGNHLAPQQSSSTAVELGETDVELPAAPSALDTPMIGIAANFEVIDRALEAALSEIEQMGGELVAWLDNSDSFALVSAGAAVLLAGGASYSWRRRRGAQLAGGELDEPSSWLFTHLYIPPVRP